MKKMIDFYAQQLRQVNSSFREYSIPLYILGLSQVVAMAETDIEHESKDYRKLYIIFEGVEYMQLIPRWQDAPFKVASPEKRKVFLEQAKIEIGETGHPHHVFYASPSNRDIFIVCSRAYVTEELPEELQII